MQSNVNAHSSELLELVKVDTKDRVLLSSGCVLLRQSEGAWKSELLGDG